MPGTLESSEIRWIIDNLIKDLLYYRNQRDNCKKWCISLWIACLIALASGKLQLQFKGTLFLLLVPIVLFWSLEGIYAGINIIINEQIRKAEQVFVGDSINRNEASDILIMSGRRNYGFNQKMIALFKALFNTESMILFYGFMALGSFGFCMLFRST